MSDCRRGRRIGDLLLRRRAILDVAAAALAVLAAACGPAPLPVATPSPTLAAVRPQAAASTPLQHTPSVVPSFSPTARPPATATAAQLPATSTPQASTVTPSATQRPPTSTLPPPSPTRASTATAQPATVTPPPATPTPLPRSAAPSIRRETVTIMTYPYARFLTAVQATDDNVTFGRLNWPAYTAAAPTPAPHTFTVACHGE